MEQYLIDQYDVIEDKDWLTSVNDIDLYPERWPEGVRLDEWFINKEEGV